MLCFALAPALLWGGVARGEGPGVMEVHDATYWWTVALQLDAEAREAGEAGGLDHRVEMLGHAVRDAAWEGFYRTPAAETMRAELVKIAGEEAVGPRTRNWAKLKLVEALASGWRGEVGSMRDSDAVVPEGVAWAEADEAAAWAKRVELPYRVDAAVAVASVWADRGDADQAFAALDEIAGDAATDAARVRVLAKLAEAGHLDEAEASLTRLEDAAWRAEAVGAMMRAAMRGDASSDDVARFERMILDSLQASDRDEARCRLALAAAETESFKLAAQMAVTVEDAGLRRSVSDAILSRLAASREYSFDSGGDDEMDVQTIMAKLNPEGRSVERAEPGGEAWETGLVDFSGDALDQAMTAAARRPTAAERGEAFAHIARNADTPEGAARAVAAGTAEAEAIVGLPIRRARVLGRLVAARWRPVAEPPPTGGGSPPKTPSPQTQAKLLKWADLRSQVWSEIEEADPLTRRYMMKALIPEIDPRDLLANLHRLPTLAERGEAAAAMADAMRP